MVYMWHECIYGALISGLYFSASLSRSNTQYTVNTMTGRSKTGTDTLEEAIFAPAWFEPVFLCLHLAAQSLCRLLYPSVFPYQM
jgi:hypothetical protein